MRWLVLLALAGTARADVPDAGVAVVTIECAHTLGGCAPPPNLVLVTEALSVAWPASCHLVVNKSGDVRIDGTDPTPCIDKLETTARLARAAQRVNRSRRK